MNKVGICNMAIGHLGISQFIASFDEASNEARNCRIFYDHALDRTLSEMPWNFATTYRDLQDIGSPPSKWLYRYRYPNDCLFLRAVTPREEFAQYDQYFNPQLLIWLNQDNFEIIEDEASGGLAICSNIAEAKACYTRRITAVQLFPALFNDCFGWSLSMDIAAPLSASQKIAEAAGNNYRSSLLRAAARSLNEGKEMLERESEFISVRN